MTVTGRSSSITNAFVNAIIPVIEPTEAEELQALSILGMSPTNIRCAYGGDKATEWDHLNPIIRNQEPTGFIAELEANFSIHASHFDVPRHHHPHVHAG